jgi:D-alanyl-D-alanine carboxypeptidase
LVLAHRAAVVSNVSSEEPIFAAAYGWADREAGVRNDLTTRFNVAFTGKMFCGTAVTQMAQAGTLHVGDPLSRWVPELARP